MRRLITQALGEKHAAPALFSLPSSGRILVSGPGGTWTAAPDGSTRRLGPWPQASWSPHGRFVVVGSGDQLAAVDPHGTVRWSLARPTASDPRWYSPSGYRVAYLSAGTLRVVAGDGTGDRLLAAGVAHVAPAWRPGQPDGPYELAGLCHRRRPPGHARCWQRPDCVVAPVGPETSRADVVDRRPAPARAVSAAGADLRRERHPGVHARTPARRDGE